jgi:hypothetical protein
MIARKNVATRVAVIFILLLFMEVSLRSVFVSLQSASLVSAIKTARKGQNKKTWLGRSASQKQTAGSPRLSGVAMAELGQVDPSSADLSRYRWDERSP